VDLHRGDEFRTWVQFLVDELERASGQVDFEELTRFWNAAVDLELASFNDVPFPLEG
jgi:thiaminase